jgi:N-acetylglutamate synthase-like GNAT family acetyltransferase
MSGLVFRTPRDDEWPAILDLAHLSLAELPVVPNQQEWLDNRRWFSPSDGIQQHLVATADERIVGYGGVERRHGARDGWYRLFAVMEPSARATLGTRLLARLRECLIDLGARHAWMMEYEADGGFVSFLERMGFVRLRTINLDDGTLSVQLAIDAPFQSLRQTIST